MSDMTAGPRQELYGVIAPSETGFLKVDPDHEIYFEVSGNPRGEPAIFVHGGPGGGSEPSQRRYWDPEHYRIVLFDQRGCGRSKPHASLKNNTTWDLVEDMEKLRAYLGIDRWQVFGGSWGSTLSLAYATSHPDRVTSLILRGIFLLRKQEIDWFYQEGASRIFPDVWQQFLAPIPENERNDLLHAYHRRLTGDDPHVRDEAARAWSLWEMACSTLVQDARAVAKAADTRFAAAFARIECHYFVNGGFFQKDGQLLDDVHRIRHIPGVIVHGRYDMICPVENAFDLHARWPESTLHVVPLAGHSAMEHGIATKLVQATDALKHT